MTQTTRMRFLDTSDSSLRSLEAVAVLPVTVLWLIGLWALWNGLLVLPLELLSVAAGGAGLLAGWIAWSTRSFERTPLVPRLGLAAGLLAGIGLALFWGVQSLLGETPAAASIYGCALVPGCRHLVRVLRRAGP